ncbi:hypothetical protein EHF33_12100 [Deinococcus psychrotolerans]|uniref:Lipoprotein n=1 Tax=Deinococcus psychrotolerans TaxID=2489213 RepID=A0A3G8YLA6_9DEIO|nr:hypothetical protein [Deinococcus psychrotolerans]AZI43394.1 hypothetical protein EHF33_12100 [Deinococcus psychrotolerans]
MNRFAAAALPLALLGALASCAPTITDTAGRLVNAVSGQEGRVLFLGGFQPRPVVVGTPDNVTVQLGQDLYSGKYSVIGNQNALGVSFGFGVGSSFGGDSGDRRSGYGGLRTSAEARNPTGPGNLILKTQRLNTAAVKTITCDFQADASGHGVGNCKGSDGSTYALQF